MYRLLFIDEEKDTLDDFEEFVDQYSGRVPLTVIKRVPLSDLDDMVSDIIKINPDALITDFRLNEMKTDISYNVPYNGVDLVSEYNSIRTDFPCFVLTAVDDEAVNQSDDVNIVYVKNIIYTPEDSKAKATFLDRVTSQIEHYKVRISNAEDELKQLIIARESGKADFSTEKRIIELDDFLEKSVDARHSIPSDFKSFSNAERLNEILKKVDNLLEKIDDDAE